MAQEQNAQTKPTQPKQRKISVPLLILIFSLVFILVAIGGLYFYLKRHTSSASTVTKSLSIPENCPKNMPLYPKAKILSITCKAVAASIESISATDLKKVKAWYLAEVPKNGWTIRAEDSASYLLENDNEIGKVSLSIEKKNTAIKFLIAKRETAAPGSTSKKSSSSPESNADFSESLINWDDYFNSIQADYASPTDEGTEVDYSEPAEEENYDEDAGETEEVISEETPEPEETIEPEPTAEPEITEEPTEEPTPDCWFDDKGGYYCN